MLKLVLSSFVVLRRVDGWPSIFWPFKLIVAHSRSMHARRSDKNLGVGVEI